MPPKKKNSTSQKSSAISKAKTTQVQEAPTDAEKVTVQALIDWLIAASRTKNPVFCSVRAFFDAMIKHTTSSVKQEQEEEEATSEAPLPHAPLLPQHRVGSKRPRSSTQPSSSSPERDEAFYKGLFCLTVDLYCAPEYEDHRSSEQGLRLPVIVLGNRLLVPGREPDFINCGSHLEFDPLSASNLKQAALSFLDRRVDLSLYSVRVPGEHEEDIQYGLANQQLPIVGYDYFCLTRDPNKRRTDTVHERGHATVLVMGQPDPTDGGSYSVAVCGQHSDYHTTIPSEDHIYANFTCDLRQTTLFQHQKEEVDHESDFGVAASEIAKAQSTIGSTSAISQLLQRKRKAGTTKKEMNTVQDAERKAVEILVAKGVWAYVRQYHFETTKAWAKAETAACEELEKMLNLLKDKRSEMFRFFCDPGCGDEAVADSQRIKDVAQSALWPLYQRAALCVTPENFKSRFQRTGSCTAAAVVLLHYYLTMGGSVQATSESIMTSATAAPPVESQIPPSTPLDVAPPNSTQGEAGKPTSPASPPPLAPPAPVIDNATAAATCSPLDITVLVRRVLAKRSLLLYLLGHGIDMFEFARVVFATIERRKIQNFKNFDRIASDIPYLVSMNVTAEFQRGPASSFPSKHTPTRLESAKVPHAMVCIGAREDKANAGQIYLLLQTTWKNRELIEVSLDYFARHDGRAYKCVPLAGKQHFRRCESQRAWTLADSHPLSRDEVVDVDELCRAALGGSQM